MLEYSAKMEKEHQMKEAAKKEQLRKIQEENLQTAIAKRNEKEQAKMNTRLNTKADKKED